MNFFTTLLKPKKKWPIVTALFFIVLIAGLQSSLNANTNTAKNISFVKNKFIHLQVQHFASGGNLITQFKFKVLPTYHINPAAVLQSNLIPTTANVKLISTNNSGNNSAAKNNNVITSLPVLWQNASPTTTINFFGENTKVYNENFLESSWHEIVLYSNLPKNLKENNLNLEKAITLQHSFTFQPCTKTICYLPETITAKQVVFFSQLPPAPSTFTKLATINNPQNNWNLVQFALAFISGLLLNLMPCVLPVLSLKANAIANSINTSRNSNKQKAATTNANNTIEFFWNNSGLFLGICATFLILSTFVAVASLSGEKLGWGFQFQQPLYLIIMALITWLMGMEICGLTNLFSFTSLLASKLVRWINKSTKNSLFEKGLQKKNNNVLQFLKGSASGITIVLLSTPCTAPIFTGVMAYAFSKTLIETYAIFLFLAIGFALPQILIATPWASKKIAKVIPKSGRWMPGFKQFLAVMLFSTSAWLVFLLPSVFTIASFNKQLFAILIGCLALLSILITIKNILTKKKFSKKKFSFRRLPTFIYFLSLIFLPYTFFAVLANYSFKAGSTAGFENKSNKEVLQVKHSMPLLSEIIKPLNSLTFSNTANTKFIIVTADWCLSCIWNEKIIFNTKKTKELFKKHNVTILLGDITQPNPYVQEFMNSLGFVGIPLYLLYTQNNKPSPNVLPALLTYKHLEEALKNN